jgi:preprotein translocase subunit YajC
LPAWAGSRLDGSALVGQNPALMNSINDFLLALTPPAADGQATGSLIGSLAPLLAIFAIFYFLVFAPMRKKQKQHTELLGQLKAGDRVLTSGGIHGTVVGVTDDLVQLRIADQVKIDVSKQAVSGFIKED